MIRGLWTVGSILPAPDGGGGDGGEAAVPLRFDRADTLVEGRVGGEEGEAAGEGLGEEEVAELDGAIGDDAGADGVGADLAEGAADAGQITNKLDGGGVGEELARTRQRQPDAE